MTTSYDQPTVRYARGTFTPAVAPVQPVSNSTATSKWIVGGIGAVVAVAALSGAGGFAFSLFDRSQPTPRPASVAAPVAPFSDVAIAAPAPVQPPSESNAAPIYVNANPSSSGAPVVSQPANTLEAFPAPGPAVAPVAPGHQGGPIVVVIPPKLTPPTEPAPPTEPTPPVPPTDPQPQPQPDPPTNDEGPIVRDHRPGCVPAPRVQCIPPASTPTPPPGSGPIIRDHRHPEPYQVPTRP